MVAELHGLCYKRLKIESSKRQHEWFWIRVLELFRRHPCDFNSLIFVSFCHLFWVVWHINPRGWASVYQECQDLLQVWSRPIQPWSWRFLHWSVQFGWRLTVYRYLLWWSQRGRYNNPVVKSKSSCKDLVQSRYLIWNVETWHQNVPCQLFSQLVKPSWLFNVDFPFQLSQLRFK